MAYNEDYASILLLTLASFPEPPRTLHKHPIAVKGLPEVVPNSFGLLLGRFREKPAFRKRAAWWNTDL